MRERETNDREVRRAGAPAESPPAERPAERKGIYLRTVYPLNPGIPHCLDFPREA
jgi:hypothetical protein